MAVKNKEDLEGKLKRCSCCGGKYLASVTDNSSKFGAFHNKRGWYYQAWCKPCFSEKNRMRSKGKKPEEIKVKIKTKREEERRNRPWSVYLITVDTTKLDNRVRNRYKSIHGKYYYVGITKQETNDRWNEHLYTLKTGEHSNYYLNNIYSNIRDLYNEMYDDEFYNLMKDGVIKFEIITELDKNMSEKEAKIYEAFEVNRLLYDTRFKNKDGYNIMLGKKKDELDLCLITDEMVTNIEHCDYNKRLKVERETKKDTRKS